jgi:hypothetical protein
MLQDISRCIRLYKYEEGWTCIPTIQSALSTIQSALSTIQSTPYCTVTIQYIQALVYHVICIVTLQVLYKICRENRGEHGLFWIYILFMYSRLTS